MKNLRYFLLATVLMLPACGSDVINLNSDTKQLYISFNESVTGWKHGVSDYAEGQLNDQYSAGQVELPSPLNTANQKGFKLSSNNHSDDMFMFVTKQFDGLQANRLYDFDFEISFATNAQKNCVGIGGAPGESVTIKAGATKNEPKSVNNGNNTYSMNIDKGNQSVGGADALAIGNFANDRECGNADTSYMKKTVRSDRGRFSAYTDTEGKIWILFGTDSGFEGVTTIYFMQARVWATPSN